MENFTNGLQSVGENIGGFFKDLSSGKANLAFFTNGSANVSSKTSLFEINLVPDIKAAALKAQKSRNMALFTFLVIGGISAVVFVIMGIVVGSQKITIDSQNKNLKTLDSKIKEFSSLNELLTLQGQLSKISDLNNQKNNISRTFYILSSILAQGPDSKGNKDKVTVSKATVDMSQSIVTIEAQADAGKDPYIDYRVLEAFKKNAYATNYDHGSYVDEYGKQIPARCVEDANSDGTLFIDNGGIYGKWYKDEKGCNPSKTEDSAEDEKTAGAETNTDDKKTTEVLDNYIKKVQEEKDKEKSSESEQSGEAGTVQKTDKDSKAVKKRYNSKPVQIWRIPKFEEWASSGNIDDSGKISGIPHFESKCTTYSKINVNGSTQWQAKNNCSLLQKPVQVLESSNARNNNGNLVLRFTAKLFINPEVFKFKNKHVIPVTPSAQNATDSYLQVENIFEQRATDCRGNDAACKDSKNSGKEK